MSGQRPTHTLSMVPKGDRSKKGRWSPIGVGWLSTNGNAISLKLNPGVSISWRDLETHDIYLFVKEPREEE